MYKRRKLSSHPPSVPPPPPTPALPSTTPPACKSCHRALALRATNPPVSCQRCSAVSCTVCSRTCTEYTRTPSNPPTPALTRSPSPAILAPTTNQHRPPQTGRRRKLAVKDPQEHSGVLLELATVQGCGRTICRDCCVESVHSDGTLCVDCYALL
ncbi:hypothetical protein BV22DRAFT_1200189 [Leucogyrophana mollusca]|uniref:Uncharacterized protein n=1 Tax=Leucogyrophana mollusca TaxID=85980 RepID=A0ACB8AXT7_9AGAM|nr:hypothetical protein BV22DRAFT_1200189 [Leucogyrophana mollusca]